MKVLIGIDGQEGDMFRETPVLPLLRALRLTNPSLELIHVVPSDTSMIRQIGWSATGAEPGNSGDPLGEQNAAVQAALLQSAGELVGVGAAAPELTALRGPAPELILAHADATGADLIAINAPRDNRGLRPMLSGGVARALLLSARQSILVARPPCSTQSRRLGMITRGVRAVLATDHSPYMNRCLERLLEFAPLGISQLTVLTAFPGGELSALRSYLPKIDVDPGDAVRERLEACNAAVLDRVSGLLRRTGATSASRVIDAPVDEAIAETMGDTGADLLILGAQGHSFWERLTLGSVSFQQVMTADYPVLVLRA